MPRMKTGPKGKITEAGQRFETTVLNWGRSLKAFYIELSKALGDTSAKTIEVKISKFINGRGPFPGRYIYATEHMLGIRIADIIDGTYVSPASPRGLYEIGTHGTYEDFEWLAAQTDGSVEVIRSYDEWSKSIVHYVYESKNLEGLRYLVDHGFYQTFGAGKFMCHCYHNGNEEEHALILLNMLAEDDDPEATMFTNLFDSVEQADLTRTGPSLLNNEAILEAILRHERLLEAVCREADLVPESRLNGPKRQTSKEYLAVCASSWLTPLLCFALAHEDEYLDQAKKLGQISLRVAREAFISIRDNIHLLGGIDESIRTEHGYVLLGHSYVIGIIGEPKTDGVIKNPDLRNLVNETTAVIGSFRALAKIQTPVKVNGKLHLPRPLQNPVYQTFLAASRGHRYLLQESESNDGDSHNDVFDAPKGKESEHSLSLEQWKQVGKALHSIHGIETGQEGQSFCHGRFIYPDIYIAKDGNVELIAGYQDVYIGNPEDDVFAMAALAFINNYVTAVVDQEPLEAFLEGYGYPREGFLEKFWNYLVSIARSEKNMNEASYLMELAVNVLRVIRARE